MKKLLYLLLFIILPFAVISQNIKGGDLRIKKKSRLIGQVTIGSRSFDNSAILTLTATDKGLLIPRLTTAERDAISSPTIGLMVYNTTTGSFEFFDGSWSAIGAAGNTIYTADDDLTGNRKVSMGANSLTFSGNLTTFKGIDATNVNFVAKFQDNVGTDLLSVRNDGRVSIGHLNPDDPLDIQFVSGEALTLRVNANTVGTSIGIDWKAKNSLNNFITYNNISGRIITNTAGSEDSQFRFWLMDAGAFSERMRLYADGTLSLGNILLNSALLNVNKAVDGNLAGMEIINTQNNTAGSINETASFHFSLGAFGSAPGAAIIRAGKIDDFTSEAKEKSFLAFYTNNIGTLTEQVRIDDLGNMGIGTTTPSSKLDVVGDVEIGSTNAFYLGDPTTDGSWRIIRSGDDLLMQQRESGVWNTKQTISGA